MQFRNPFRKAEPAAPPRVPDGVRVYAVGDVHGRLDCLDEILVTIETEARRDGVTPTIVLLGDLVDRGPDSRGVVDRAMALRGRWPVHFLKGNHEELFLLAAQGERQALALLDRIGGRETLLSYGVDEQVYEESDLGTLEQLIATHVPAEHLAFLESFEDLVTIGDYIFVHAGLRPGVPLDRQKPSDLRWIRARFLDYAGTLPGMVVHGHTITAEPEERANRIGIDTGAYATGRLTALGLEGDRRWLFASAC